MHDTERTANLLGATALAVNDLLLSAVTGASGVSSSAAAALVVLASSDGLSVTELGRRIGLSQPAAARMVDSLEANALVQRQRTNLRSVSVRLTRNGRQAARRLLSARRTPLADVVEALDPADQDALVEVLERLLGHLYSRIGSSELICRLCDRACCTDGATCPVGAAERAAAH